MLIQAVPMNRKPKKQSVKNDQEDKFVPCCHGFSQKDWGDMKKVRRYSGSTGCAAGGGVRSVTVWLHK